MAEKAAAGLVSVFFGSSAEPSSGSEHRFEEAIDPTPKATLLNSDSFSGNESKFENDCSTVSFFSPRRIGWAPSFGLGFGPQSYVISPTGAQFS